MLIAVDRKHTIFLVKKWINLKDWKLLLCVLFKSNAAFCVVIVIVPVNATFPI